MRHRTVALALLSCVVLPGGAAGQTPPSGRASGPRIFALDLAGTPAGDVPASIEVRKGLLEVVQRDGVPVLKASAASEFVIQLSQVLPRDFTLEFDLIPKLGSNPQDLSFEGMPTINQGDGSAHVLWHATGYLSVIGGGGDTYEAPMPEELRAALPGVLTHLVVEVQGDRIQLYTNGRQLFSLQKQFARGQVLRVFLGGQNDRTEAVYLAGLRISAGTGLVTAAQATPPPGVPQHPVKPSKGAGLSGPTTSTSASTGTTTSAGAGISAAGTGSIATTAPGAVTTIAPQTATAMPMLAPGTPTIISIVPMSSTSVQITVQNTPATMPDEPQFEWDHFIIERHSIDDVGGCPADFLTPPDPSRCFRHNYPWTGWAEDYGLEQGVSYSYRVASVFKKNCEWEPCEEKVLPSLPFSFTRPAQLLGIVTVRQGLVAPSLEPRNVEVGRLTDPTVSITWTASIGVGQPNPAVPNEVAWLWIVDQWADGTPSTCPTVAGTSLKVTDESNCTRRILADDGHLQAWVESGTTYRFQVTSIFGTGCKWLGCATYRGYSAAPVTYKAPVFFTPQRPVQGSLTPVLAPLFLQVAKQGSRYAEWGCDSSWGRCAQRNVDFVWAPAANAAGYVISVDEINWTYWGEEIVEVGVRSVPAGPAPEARFALYAGATVRACLAIVGDPNLPPNPRKGECIEVSITP